METGLILIHDEIENYQREIDTFQNQYNEDFKKVKNIETDIQNLTIVMQTKTRQLSSMRLKLDVKKEKINNLIDLQTKKKNLLQSIAQLASKNITNDHSIVAANESTNSPSQFQSSLKTTNLSETTRSNRNNHNEHIKDSSTEKVFTQQSTDTSSSEKNELTVKNDNNPGKTFFIS